VAQILDGPEPRIPALEAPSDLSPTEASLPATADLDRRTTDEILLAIHEEDRHAVASVAAVLPEIARAVDVLKEVLEGGGRWFNVGAGTSGRLGCVDAAEIPPTFGFAPERIEGLIAGGPAALLRAREGAEDDAESARVALRTRNLAARDAVVALSASGRTPYALAGLETAYLVGARRIAITCDPDSPLARAAEIAIARHANVISLHPSRKGGSAPDGDRLRRWVDHLEGITDTVAAVRRATGRTVVAVITEPMGNASKCSSSRECDPDAAVFGGVTGMFSAAGYIYHRIASQDPATPGLADLAAIVEQLPASGCVYRNDHNGGATDGFTWKGKVRSYLCGSKGFVLAYGLDTVGTETWVHGWHPVETLYSSPAHESGAFARSKGKVYRVAK